MKKTPNSTSLPSINYKICLLGGQIGKTAYKESIIFGKHDPSVLASATIEENFKKEFKFEDKSYAVEIKDTGGDDAHEELRPTWYQWGEAFIIMFNVSAKESLELAEFYHKKLTESRIQQKKLDQTQF